MSGQPGWIFCGKQILSWRYNFRLSEVSSIDFEIWKLHSYAQPQPLGGHAKGLTKTSLITDQRQRACILPGPPIPQTACDLLLRSNTETIHDEGNENKAMTLEDWLIQRWGREITR